MKRALVQLNTETKRKKAKILSKLNQIHRYKWVPLLQNPWVPSSNGDSGFRISSFSVSSSASLSESLVNPRRQVKRRTNEYVKERPQSREVLENQQNLQSAR